MIDAVQALALIGRMMSVMAIYQKMCQDQPSWKFIKNQTMRAAGRASQAASLVGMPP
jgi:hypothetical protein